MMKTHLYEELDGWADTWEQPTIIPPEKREPLRQKMAEAEIGLSKLTPNRLLSPGDADPHEVISAAVTNWGCETVHSLQTIFMELLNEVNPLVDSHRIDTTVSQIRGIGIFVASCGCRHFESVMLDPRNKLPWNVDRIVLHQKAIWREINKLAVRWIGEFRDWVEKKRNVAVSPAPPAAGYTVADLCEIAGVCSAPLGRHARKTNVRRPGPGQRNFCYPLTDARLILERIIKFSNAAARKRCQAWLRKQKETPKKLE